MKKEVIKAKIKDFFSDNTVSAMLDNILAMFPSTLLMPLLINASIGYEVFDISLVLCLTGITTLLFLIYTQGKLPGYLGSSFAFIGVSTYIYAQLTTEELTQELMSRYLMGAYFCAGIYLLLLSGLCKIGDRTKNGKGKGEKFAKIINKIVPPAVRGPAVSLIGLELSGQAVAQASLNAEFSMDSLLAIITIVLIVLLSVTRRPIFKKSSILLGVFIAGIIAIIMNKWDLSPVAAAPVFRVPSFKFALPKFSIGIALVVFPPTLILFCEHLVRKMNTEALIADTLKNKNLPAREHISLFRSVSGNAMAIMMSGLLGGVPLTMYEENIGVMRINKDTRPNQYYLAAVVVIILSFSGNLLSLIQSIPAPIIGGLSFVLMGIIAAPGIKMLVDEKVDYTKITNLFLTASVLIVGLSDMSLKFFGTELKGMSLGLLVGIFLNLIFKLLGLMHLSREHVSFQELTEFCRTNYLEATCKITDNESEYEYTLDGVKFLQISNDADNLRIEVLVEEQDDDCLKKYNSKKIEGRISLVVDGSFKDEQIKRFIKKSYELAEKKLLTDFCRTNYPEASCSHTDDESKCEYALGGVIFLQISHDDDNLKIEVLVEEQDDECLIKYNSKKIEGRISLVVDDSFKVEELKGLIKKSYELAEKKLSTLKSEPPEENIAETATSIDAASNGDEKATSEAEENPTAENIEQSPQSIDAASDGNEPTASEAEDNATAENAESAESAEDAGRKRKGGKRSRR